MTDTQLKKLLLTLTGLCLCIMAMCVFELNAMGEFAKLLK